MSDLTLVRQVVATRDDDLNEGLASLGGLLTELQGLIEAEHTDISNATKAVAGTELVAKMERLRKRSTTHE